MDLTISQSPSSACAHMPRMCHGPDCFTVSTCCTYIDLGSRGYFGVNVALVISMILCHKIFFKKHNCIAELCLFALSLRFSVVISGAVVSDGTADVPATRALCHESLVLVCLATGQGKLRVNSLTPGKCGSNLKVWFSNSLYRRVAGTLAV